MYKEPSLPCRSTAIVSCSRRMLPQSRESIQLAPANASRSNAMPDTRTYVHIQITSVNQQLLTIMPHGLSNYFKLSS